MEVRARDAATGKPLHQPLYMFEKIGGQKGLSLQLSLSDDGVGHVPGGLAGSTLSFSTLSFTADEYTPVVIKDWNGARLELRFTRPAASR